MADTFPDELLVAMFLLRLRTSEGKQKANKQNKENLKEENYFGRSTPLSYIQG